MVQKIGALATGKRQLTTRIMPTRIATSLALIAFAVCLVIGGLGAGNTFSTTVLRAMLAMACTFLIGLLIGHMAQKMLLENLKAEEEKLRKSEKSEAADR